MNIFAENCLVVNLYLRNKLIFIFSIHELHGIGHHIFNTSEEIHPLLLKGTPLYIIMDIVSLTVNHTLCNHVTFTLREKNE